MTSRIAVAIGLAAAAAMPAAELRPPSVGVLLKFDQKSYQSAAQQLQRAVQDIFRPSGLDLRWEVMDAGRQPAQYDRVVIVEIRGRCTPWRIDEVDGGAADRRALGWTRVNQGEVTPFSVVDCDQIARALRIHPAVTPHSFTRYNSYWRLAGRVMAHELIHALLRTTEHFGSDCTRSPLLAFDLHVGARLQPAEVAALRRLGRAPDAALAGRPGQTAAASQ